MSRRDWSTANFLSNLLAPVTAVPMSMACWFRDSITGSADQHMVGVYNSSNNARFSLRLNASNQVIADTDTSATNGAATTTTGYTANVWYHACGVWASATDRRAFLNGGGKGTNATSLTPAGINQVVIGTRGGATPGSAYAPAGTGDIGEFAIWNVALSDADVLRLASGIAAIAVQRQSLVGYWHCDGGGGSEFNTINPGAPLNLSGALSLSAPPQPFFMPKLAPIFSL